MIDISISYCLLYREHGGKSIKNRLYMMNIGEKQKKMEGNASFLSAIRKNDKPTIWSFLHSD